MKPSIVFTENQYRQIGIFSQEDLDKAKRNDDGYVGEYQGGKYYLWLYLTDQHTERGGE